MDEEEFRDTLRRVNDQQCVFEKCILNRNAACAQAQLHAIGERETVGCGHSAARQQCAALLRLLREKATFALGSSDMAAALPHVKALRLQAGGLQGLRTLMNSATAPNAPIDDVYGLVQQLRARYGGLSQLPFETVIRAIAAFRVRRRTRRRGDY
jgi:hypothetical protein